MFDLYWGHIYLFINVGGYLMKHSDKERNLVAADGSCIRITSVT